MSPPEVRRLTATMKFLRGTRLSHHYAVLGDGLLDLPEPEIRQIISATTSYIVQAQGRAGIPQHWLRVLESTGGLHANIIFPGSDALAEQLLNSRFGQYLGGAGKGLQRIGKTTKDWHDLTGYLAKQRVPQGDRYYRKILGPRERGSHQLGAGGGDRVHLSPALRAAVIEAGVVLPWHRTTSRNLTHLRKPVTGASSGSKPVLYRTQLDLFPQAPRATFNDPSDLRRLREKLGYTQEQAARRLHIRDRSHIANAERGHDRLSPPRVRYLRYLAENARL